MSSCCHCQHRNGKRWCPPLDAHICPVCCAGLRMMTIACDEECPSLRDARDATGKRLSNILSNALAAEGYEDVTEDNEHLTLSLLIMGAVDSAIVRVRRAHYSDLSDAEVLAALDLVLRTYETLERGLLYEHRSESPRIQHVRDGIFAELDAFTKKVGKRGGRLRTGDIVRGLALAKKVATTLQKETDAQAYIRTASLYQPYPPRESRLIITP